MNRLYLNSLLVSIVYPCVSKQKNEISMRVKTPTCQTRKGYLNNEKRAESFSLSEVVQRFSGDGKVIRWQNSFRQFRRTIRDWSHSCISPLTGMFRLMRILIVFSFWLNNLYTEIKIKLKERFIRFFLCWTLQCLQMKPSFVTTGHVVSKF